MDTKDPWFVAMYEQWAHRLLKTATILLGNRAVAEEKVHDVFLLLLMRRDEVELYDHPEAWLFKVLFNKVNNELRRAKYKNEVPYDPEYHQMISIDEISNLEGFLPPGLSDGERQILIWYFERDLSHKEMARMLGCDVHASHSRLSRAKAKCKKLLLKEKIFCNSE